MPKIKTKAKWWYEWHGGWEFDPNDQSGIFKEIEIDSKLLEKYYRIEKEFEDVCEEVRKEINQ